MSGVLHERCNFDDAKPKILFLDTQYTIKMVKERGLEQEFASRECGGYFGHVWGVHPIADIPEKRKLNYGGFEISLCEFSQGQTIIEGESAYFSCFRRFFPLNFLVSQIRFLFYLIALVRRERISIVLSTDPYLCGIFGLLIKWVTGTPLVIWVVANYDDTFKATGKPAMPRLFRRRWLEKIVERCVFRWSNLVAGGNQDNLEFSLKNGATLNKTTVFPVGKLIHRHHLVDPRLRDVDGLILKNKDSYYFIYVGRLLEVKHPDDVLRAFSVLDRELPSCTLLMAGDGTMRPDLEELARDLAIYDRVFFLGNVSQERLAKLLAGCFAVFSPLTGRSLIESALAGLPIVAYDRDWQSDFVGRSGAGIVVPFRDWRKMGGAAIRLVRQPEEARKMAEASRQKGLELCDLEKIYEHERKEYEKLLSGSAVIGRICRSE